MSYIGQHFASKSITGGADPRFRFKVGGDHGQAPQADDRCHSCGKPSHLIGPYPELVLAFAANAFGVAQIDILSRRRNADFVRARAFVVWALRSLGVARSYPKIGMVLERDHSSIIHLHQKAIRLRLEDKEFAQACHRIISLFYQARGHTHG